jgi:hypothetical protein
MNSRLMRKYRCGFEYRCAPAAHRLRSWCAWKRGEGVFKIKSTKRGRDVYELEWTLFAVVVLL